MPLNVHGPYLRWAGGKARLAGRLLRFVPELGPEARYFEPFVGAAALFLRLSPRRAVLSDLNRELIKSYEAVRDRPALVAKYLRGHARNHSREHYLKVRAAYNRARSTQAASAAQSARFIYLNRTCFNGIYRVNMSGEFNVPFGMGSEALFPTERHLRLVAVLLRKSKLMTASFEQPLKQARAGDFVYLDPPYPPLNGTSFFRHYTADRFNELDQLRVRDAVASLADRGCQVMVSNADTPIIRELYAGFKINPLLVTRYVSSSGIKHSVGEIVITSYDVHVPDSR
jgi:DNA adenine methylase